MGWVFLRINFSILNYIITNSIYVFFSWTKAKYVYSVFQHQSCVYRTKAQYDRSNVLLTDMSSSSLCCDVLSADCIKAIENIQMTMVDKEKYLAFHAHVQIPISFDAITTSPVESMNSSLKNGMGINQNSNTRWVGRCINRIT